MSPFDVPALKTVEAAIGIVRSLLLGKKQGGIQSGRRLAQMQEPGSSGNPPGRGRGSVRQLADRFHLEEREVSVKSATDLPARLQSWNLKAVSRLLPRSSMVLAHGERAPA